jgi:hypothetical protein
MSAQPAGTTLRSRTMEVRPTALSMFMGQWKFTSALKLSFGALAKPEFEGSKFLGS